ncbi:MAG: ATP-binding protein [Desulfopila sp.]|jgi:dedicated sortase system histidine kinase|nr:ATP-binding protein [Desulfopila sp.]
MRFSLRLKLALIALLLPALPYSGIQLAALVKANLLESKKESLMFSARAVASALSGREGLFDEELFHSLNQGRDLYLFQLTNPMRLNGKTDDWEPYLKNAKLFGAANILETPHSFVENGSGFRHLIGRRGEYIYAIFLVLDEHLVYREKNSLALDRSDHLKIAIEDRQGNLNRYIIAANGPGWVNGSLIAKDFDSILPAIEEPRIQGVWLETSTGYTLEIRLPQQMVGNRLAFAIADVDNTSSRETETLIGTASIDEPEKIGWLLTPSSSIEKILQSFKRPEAKIQIVDSNQHIRASYGSLKISDSAAKTPPAPSFSSYINQILSPLYRLFTEPFADDFADPLAQPSTRSLAGVTEALKGQSSLSSYRIAEGKVEVMAAVEPLYENDTIIGAVVVEQTTNSILALQNRVIEESLSLTLLVLVFGGSLLFFFAYRISSRIGKLRDQAAGAIDNNGQIHDTITPPARSGDEIDDLSRTLHSVLSRLKTQSLHREKMADNLEHEIRTPLSGASASLKNLAQELVGQPDSILEYVNWAQADIRRMEDLLSNIRDATSLEDALAQGFTERFDLSEALALWLEHGWRSTFTEVDFLYEKPAREIFVQGDPDRIRQMLDKLLENAVAFHQHGTAVELHLEPGKSSNILKVINQGPPIPDTMLEEIFNSMVSIRTANDTSPHLGLGLFVARTIARYHNGSIRAANLEDGRSGVCFYIELPQSFPAES